MIIMTDSISTSHAGIKSADATDDKSAELAQLLSERKTVVIDTPIAVNTEISTFIPHQQIIGAPGGSLLIGPSMGNSTALRIGGDHSIVRGLQMYNPLEVVDRTRKTTRQAAIGIEAHHVQVHECHFDQMLHAVYVISNGEWYGAIINGNTAMNCLGAGGGPLDLESSWGEDKGDAFAAWGAGVRMTNNFAHARDDQDCRIAFHAEGLPGSHWRKNPLTDERDFIMANNIAAGPFRRHYVFEDVGRGLMQSNISRGGATWWNVALIQTFDCHVNDMLLKVTRKETEMQGQYWKPNRAAIAIINFSDRCSFSHINAHWEPDAKASALFTKDDPSEQFSGNHNSRFHDVNFYMNPELRNRGLDVTGLTSGNFDRTLIVGAGEPIYGFKPKGKTVFTGLELVDVSKPIRIQGTSADSLVFDGGHIDNLNSDSPSTDLMQITQMGTVAVKNFNSWGVPRLACIFGLSYLKQLTVAQCESMGQPATVYIENSSSRSVPVPVNMVGNININGDFTNSTNS